MKIITMHHILGNKVLEYDVDDRGVIVDEREYDRTVNPTDGGNNSIIFFNNYGSSYMDMAFYNSIGFDSVPTKENDGFTEQDLINYVLENLITK
ncbi:hypothetical protein [uncultured phage cr6_1]|uniref:Uncharacterized protein n=1 Tax=uncultured phage cr6_1 TaxID=2772085 RepID=A0A7M1RU05_9CAUD|nr:hypothetical protein KNV52_gp05 [uncultured phage cr6_1]QOR57179.1 hypothetical protein [uncultured phage cr6_1]